MIVNALAKLFVKHWQVNKMRLAIMQPYLFPYIGYFQLIHSADKFVVYDDVNFIKGGWINRNFILTQGQAHRITLQLQGASPNVLINQVRVGNNRIKLLKSIQQSYAKAPQFSNVFPMVEEIILNDEVNLAKYLEFGLRKICAYLDIMPEWFISSKLQKDTALKGPEKVLAICDELDVKHYINVPGGKSLYDYQTFEARGLKLSFIEPNAITYKQFKNEYVPNLSIIDVMMFNDQQACLKLIEEYRLV